MGSVVLNGATSGATTITPTDGVTATLTLPSTTGTLLTSSGAISNLAGGSNGTIPYQSASGTTQMLAVGTSGQVLQTNGAGAPSWVTPSVGKVLQVVTGTKTSSGFTTSSTYGSTGLYATITPTSSTSKILVIASSHNFYPQTGGISIQLWRGTSGEASGSSLSLVLISNASGNYIPGGFSYYDSPSSTSALTYTAMQKSNNNSSLVGLIGDAATGTSTIVLMEIAA